MSFGLLPLLLLLPFTCFMISISQTLVKVGRNMATVTKTNYNTRANNIAGFVEKYWMHIIGAIVVIPWLMKYLRKMNWSLEEQTENHEKDELFRENKNPTKLNAKYQDYLQAYGIDAGSEEGQRLIGFAQSLAADTGFIYSDTDNAWSVLDPRGWTENDGAVYNTCINIMNGDDSGTGGDFAIVQELYFIYTRSRLLQSDVVKVLDGNLIDNLRSNSYYSFL